MNTKFKRQYRELSDDTKRRIQASSKGKPKSALHRQHIAQAMREYWKGVPNKAEHTTMYDVLGISDNNKIVNPSNNEKSM